MLDDLTTQESFLNNVTASFSVMCITYIKLPFDNGNCDQHHLTLQLLSVVFKMLKILSMAG